MKIRSDFVTNSSSSSFVGIFATTKDDKLHHLMDEEDVWYDLDYLPSFKKSKLCYRKDTDGEEKCIETIGELMGVVAYPMYQEEVSNNEFVYIFRYKLGDIEHEELAKEILDSGAFEGFTEEYEDAEELAEVMDEFMQEIFDEFYLPFKNNEDEEDDDCYGQETIEELMNFARENTLQDISTLTVNVCDFERDEGMNQYIDILCDLIDEGKIEFHQMDREDPGFEEAVDRLEEAIEEMVFQGKAYEIYEDLRELIADGLEVGEAWQMLPSSLTIEEETTLDFVKHKQKR